MRTALSLNSPAATAASTSLRASGNRATDAIIDDGACWPSTDAAAKNAWVGTDSAATRARITPESSRGAGRPPALAFSPTTPISSSNARQ